MFTGVSVHECSFVSAVVKIKLVKMSAFTTASFS